MIGKYIINLLISIDQMVNTLFLGSPDETISSRVGRTHPNSVLAKTINFIFFWDRNHVTSHIEPEDRSKDGII